MPSRWDVKVILVARFNFAFYRITRNMPVQYITVNRRLFVMIRVRLEERKKRK